MIKKLIKLIGTKILPKFEDTFTSWIKEKISQKGEIQKGKREKQETVYLKLLDLLQVISDDPCYIFNYDKVIAPFKELRTVLNMYASIQLLDALEPFYKKVLDTYEEYAYQFCTKEYEAVCDARKEYGDDELDFEREKEEYMEAHKIPDAEIDKIRRELIDIMRKDLS